jgi:hypothetical protein
MQYFLIDRIITGRGCDKQSGGENNALLLLLVTTSSTKTLNLLLLQIDPY